MVDLILLAGDVKELIGELRRSRPGVSVLVLGATIEAGHVEEVRQAGPTRCSTR